jgi:RNase P subunit RPR2
VNTNAYTVPRIPRTQVHRFMTYAAADTQIDIDRERRAEAYIDALARINGINDLDAIERETVTFCTTCLSTVDSGQQARNHRRAGHRVTA